MFSRLLLAPSRLSIEAERLVHRSADGMLQLTCGVRIRGEGLELRAEQAWLDAAHDLVVLEGGVQVLQDGLVLLAERVSLDRRQSKVVLDRATILIKEGGTAADMRRCRSATGLVETGINSMRLDGQRWVREGRRWKIQDVRFTACDCGAGERPSWELRAGEADVLLGDRAWLFWPVLALKGLPVFILPVAYLPLADRQTGLMMPRVGYSGRDGFVLSESLFVTLGRSADTTLSLDWFEERGFRPRIEIRATPVAGSWVVARGSFIDDAKAQKAMEEGLRAAEFRGSAELDARMPFGGGWGLRGRLRLYSDSDMSRDFSSGMDGRAADLAPSRLIVDWRGEDAWLGLDAAWRQDLRVSAVDLFSSAGPDLLERLGGDPVGDTIQRLGAFDLRMLPRPVMQWPIHWSLRLEGANLSSLQAAWRDWGLDGTPNPREPAYSGESISDYGADDGPGGEGDGQLGDGELRRAFRVLIAPRLDVPLHFEWGLQADAFVSHRQFVYLPHGPEAPGASTRGLSLVGLSLGTELGRLYRSSKDDWSLGHSISPRVRFLGAWRGLAQGEVRHVLDAEDRLLGDAVQVLAELETALHLPEQWGFRRALRLRLWQALDLRSGRMGQAAAELELAQVPISGRVVVVMDWHEQLIAEVDAQLRLVDGRGDFLRAAYLHLPSVYDDAGRPLPLAERCQRELNVLFGLAPEAYRALGESLHVLGLDARLVLGWGLSLQGGVHINLRDRWVDWFDAGLTYRSDCRCWATSITVRKWRGQDLPDVFFWLDLSVLGRAGGSSASRF
ncbi:MAG: LPS-assembly protein LptD [Deltaproteobacteria bacterium]|nr:LPS-assembly protein LptD [Deltaproteobacteria bacterium]